MAEGGRERPARRSGEGGIGGIGDAEGWGMRSFAGGSGGDSGGGDMLMSWTASGSRARPLPLSGLGGAGGGRSSGPGEAVALAVLRWISLRR